MTHERNSLSEQIETDKVEISFKDLLRESQKELDNLREQITTGEGIFDPIIQKKKELFVRMKLIRQQLKDQWKLLQEEEKAQSADRNPVIAAAKNKLMVVMEELKGIILLIKNLTVNAKDKNQETAVKKQIAEFNENTEAVYEEMTKLFKDYQSLEKNIQRITNLKYGENISDYMNYTTATLKALVTVGLAWFSTLGEAAQAAGSIFYPISATFTSSAKLFSFLGRTTQFFIASNETSKGEINELRKLELDDTKALLKRSAAFKFLAFSFSAVSILAFAGILATPIGWAFVAAATLVDWVDDGLGASQIADKALEKFKTHHQAALADPENEANKKTLDALQLLQEKADKAKSEARWGFANTVAMVLIACGPVPFVGPFLGLAGLATFGIVSIRNTYVAVKPYIEKYLVTEARPSSTEQPKQEQEAITTPAPGKKHEAVVEAAMRVGSQLREILNNRVISQESEKVSLDTPTEKPSEKTGSSLSKISPGLFKAASDNSPSPPRALEINNKKIRQSSIITNRNSSIKGG